MGFFGHAYATASYLVRHPTFGWLCFGGRVSEGRDAIRIEPQDSGRSRVFIAPARLWVELAAGKIEAVEYSPADGSVRLQLAPSGEHTPLARLSLQATAGRSRVPAPAGTRFEHGWLSVELGPQSTFITIPGSN
jgi:hypothetical protein